MGRHGILHSAVGAAHETNESRMPRVTIGCAPPSPYPAAMLWLPGTRVLDIFNCAGTLCAFGFLGAYALISCLAPAYLARNRYRCAAVFRIAAASLGLLLFPAAEAVIHSVVAGEILSIYLWRLPRTRYGVGNGIA